ncbi:hypothetical protein B1729_07470 [Microbacterium sp. B35-04]|uniref:hypothetical protein n=1 Tax=Microbacterium sp. B35-04 TaxID=1961716 RepID=UPI0013D67912|nr:hypothetical protein [Microbacterium sp. B35-04]KAF2413893.1 hypothetical protein B1729_07470 [Microbacterium sp. B35-04]
MAEAWGDVEPTVPVLFVPVRVETQSRHAIRDGEPVVELRVRIYPDDIAIDEATGRPTLLPDSFRVVVWQGDVQSAADGEPVMLDDLGVRLGHLGAPGEDRARAEAEFRERTLAMQALASEAAGAADWMRDYDVAVQRGLAVTVTLAGGDATIDRLYVSGLRRADPDAESDAVLAALRAHGDRALLGPGTPTNNTEAARSGWHASGTEPGAGVPATGGAVVARALGLDDPAAFDDWAGGAEDDELPRRMAEVLWPVTWEPWLRDAVAARALSAFDRWDVREHLADWVRPSGPLPTLRAGRQPYGLLPVTVTPEYTAAERADALVAFAVRAAWPSWTSAAAPPTVTGGDLAGALPRILGLAPASRNVRVRRILRTDSALGASLRRTAPGLEEERADVTRDLEMRLGVRPGALRGVPHIGQPRMLGLPLVHDTDDDALAVLAETTDETFEESVLQLLATVARASSFAAARASLAEIMRRMDFGDEEIDIVVREPQSGPGTELRDTLVQRLRGTMQPGRDASEDEIRLDALMSQVTRPDVFDFGEMTSTEVPRGELERLRGQGRGFIEALRRSPLSDRLFPAFSLASLVRELAAMLLEYLFALDTASRVRQGVAGLTGLDQPHRERLFAGALDASSHRLDAWATSLATRRLEQLRASRPRGVVVASYAWLEDIALSPRPEDPDEPVRSPGVGWLQAPSPRHAATAAVLRSARLTHAPGDGAAEALEIDLSSTRSREAIDIVRGMRQGQQLGALLGYRFERWLHETDLSLNRFVPALRALAPLVVGRETPATAGSDALAYTGAVVDGVVLREKPPSAVAGGLASPGPGVTPASADEVAVVQSLIARLDEVADAVADLLLAEGVHQLAGGDAARATAAMNAMSGDTLPEEPDVPRSPVERHGVTSRVAVLGGGAASGMQQGQGWVPGIRSRAHPLLEAWCRDVLGRADRIAVQVRPNGTATHLSILRLGALDLVLAADGSVDGLARFWARCRRVRPSLPAEPPTGREGLRDGRISLGDAWELATAARAVLTAARPLEPGDLVAGGGSVAPAFAVDETDLAARAQQARDDLSSLVGDLPTDRTGLLRRADALALVGIGDGTDPATLAGTTVEELEMLRGYVAGLDGLLASRLAAAATAPPREALGELVGGVPAVAQLDPTAAPELAGALLPIADGLGVRKWIARLSTVRPAVGAYATLAALRRATGRGATVRAAVFGADRWIGDAEPPSEPVTALVFEPTARFEATATIAGFVIDQWTEHRPALRTVDDATEPPTREHLVSTGLAVHANAPGARAPQALLLAVSPDGAGWTEERVHAVFDEVRLLLRMRLATPADVPGLGEILPAIGVHHWSLIDEHVVDPQLLLSPQSIVATFTRGA